MIFDRRDIELMRLAGVYQWLPYEALCGVESLWPIRREMELLSQTGIMTVSRSRQYVFLSPQGYEALNLWGYSYLPKAKRPYAGSPALRRRLETARIMFTCLAAGIGVTALETDDLAGEPVFLPAFALRIGDGNLMNAASCAGFGHWGGTGYLIYYAGVESPGMYLSNELRHLHNLASVFDQRLNTPEAVILAGESYGSVYELLRNKTPSLRHGKHGFVDFWDAYERLDLPLQLVSCDDIGAMQLAVMRQSDYRARIARAAFGARWVPVDETIPDADGHVEGCPLVVAVDMDLRRILRVCSAAQAQGRREAMVAALPGQMSGLLLSILPRGSGVQPLRIGRPVLENAFGNAIRLEKPDTDPGPATDELGVLRYV